MDRKSVSATSSCGVRLPAVDFGLDSHTEHAAVNLDVAAEVTQDSDGQVIAIEIELIGVDVLGAVEGELQRAVLFGMRQRDTRTGQIGIAFLTKYGAERLPDWAPRSMTCCWADIPMKQ